MKERIEEIYLGLKLIAACRNDGEFQGIAWEKKDGKFDSIAHIKGSSLEDVISKLKKTVDMDPQFNKSLIEKQERFKQSLIEKHGEFLRRKGISPEGLSAHEVSRVYDRSHRTTGCYECKSGLDNEIDLECPRCSWIICNNCGACGCGHPQHGPMISKRLTRIQNEKLVATFVHDKGGSKSFNEYAAATEYLRQHPSAMLKRHPSGEGWVVTYKSSSNKGDE